MSKIVGSLIKFVLVISVAALSDLQKGYIKNSNNFLPDSFELFGDNPERTESGEKLVEGDIVVPNSTEYEEMFRKSTFNLLTLWPFGNVSYNFHSSVNSKVKKVIKEALKHWEEHTCLSFKEKSSDWWFLRFRTDTLGCWTYVGHQSEPLIGQDVSIGPGCESRGIVVHEVGHAIGLYHEQSRSDRDKYITLLWDNMREGTSSQFTSTTDINHGVEYDLSSIMHYSPMAFSKYMFEKNTVVSKNPHLQRLMGHRRELSFRDIKIVNKMYSCDFFCPNKEELLCQNEGYASPYRNDGKPCRCVCPHHTKGTYCEEIIANYYGSSSCGGNVTTEMNIETPNYPERKEPYQSCTWWIQAPSGKRVSVLFKDFSFVSRFNRPGHKYHNLCASERVEIRKDNPYEGKMYCGTDILPGTKLTSTSNFFIILIQATGFTEGRGLKAKVSFV